CRFRHRLQRRDHAGFSPASLLCPRWAPELFRAELYRTFFYLSRKNSAWRKIAILIEASSSAEEFHPHALTVPDVNLSVHPAPIDRPQGGKPVASEKTAKAVGF